MPYKDPEKAKAAKREWDRKNRGRGKTHSMWWGYRYFDDPNEGDDWDTPIRESGYECIWAIHDKDVRPTGEVKMKHAHVAVRFSHAVDFATAKEVLCSFGVKEASIQFRDNWRGVCRYMTHMDDPDKYQYDPSIVCECGGADWHTEIYRTSDKYAVIAAMQDWCDDPANVKPNGCPPQFNDLMRYARENNQEWFMALCDNCSVVMREYCKSNRHDWRDSIRSAWYEKAQAAAAADAEAEWPDVEGGSIKVVEEE